MKKLWQSGFTVKRKNQPKTFKNNYIMSMPISEKQLTLIEKANAVKDAMKIFTVLFEQFCKQIDRPGFSLVEGSKETLDKVYNDLNNAYNAFTKEPEKALSPETPMEIPPLAITLPTNQNTTIEVL